MTGFDLPGIDLAAFIEATRLIAEEGSFKGFAGNGPSAPLNPFFTKDLADRS